MAATAVAETMVIWINGGGVIADKLRLSGFQILMFAIAQRERDGLLVCAMRS